MKNWTLSVLVYFWYLGCVHMLNIYFWVPPTCCVYLQVGGLYVVDWSWLAVCVYLEAVGEPVDWFGPDEFCAANLRTTGALGGCSCLPGEDGTAREGTLLAYNKSVQMKSPALKSHHWLSQCCHVGLKWTDQCFESTNWPFTLQGNQSINELLTVVSTY